MFAKDQSQLKDELQASMQDLLLKLSANLSFGYVQGMNYVVMALYRVTRKLDLTYSLALKLFQNEKLTRVFLDTTAETMNDICSQLKVYIEIYLPRLG